MEIDDEMVRLLPLTEHSMRVFTKPLSPVVILP